MNMDDDDLWRLKMGRFSDVEERLYARLLRFGRSRGDGLSSRALAWRARHVDGAWRLNQGPQVVVKAAGSRKSRAGARACVRYAARLRDDDHDQVPLFDEFGRELPGNQVFKVLDSWGLEPDGDNLSAQARRGGEAGLPERRRLRTVQTWHFVLSITTEPDRDVEEPLVRAAAATIDALFTRHGYRVIWALHRDHLERPHVHAVVKAVSETGARLRCDIHGDLFDTMRAEFAANLSAAGLPFQAARREDRSDLRAQVMKGEVPLRPWRRRAKRGDLMVRAPGWFARFGEDYIKRLKQGEQTFPPESVIGRLWRKLAVRSDAPPRMPAALAVVYPLFQRVYRNPHRAMASWRHLAAEGGTGASTRRLAEWYVRHRPEVFGELLPGVRPNGDLALQLRKVVLPSVEAVPMMPSPNPALVAELVRIRWRRRVARDRRRVIGSLLRLAGIARVRLGEDLARRVVRRALGAAETPIGPMPFRKRGDMLSPARLRPVGDWGEGGAHPSPAPHLDPVISRTPSARPVKLPSTRRPGRDGAER